MSGVLIGPGAGTEFIEFIQRPELYDILRVVETEYGELHFSDAAAGTPAFAAELRSAEALLLLGQLSLTDLTQAARLQIVSVAATGYEMFIDAHAAYRLGKRVAYVPAYGIDAVAEHALAMALAAAKNLVPSHGAVRRGEWPQPTSVQLRGSVAGVVGLGPIGHQMVQLLEGIGCRVLVWTPNATRDRLAGTKAEFASLEQIFSEADLVSLHLAHTPDTDGLVTDALLARAKLGMILVNTARAGLVEPGALEQRAARGQIKAAVDVLAEEPPSADLLRRLPEAVLITPHTAYNTASALAALIGGALQNLVLHARGAPLEYEVVGRL